MNYRTAYIRRSRKGLRIKKRIAAVVVLGVAACAALALQQRTAGPGSMMAAATAAPAAFAATAAAPLRIADAADANGTRRVYRYSVVPGGVASRAELAHIVRADKVVAAHYASFQVDKARPVAVAAPRAVYVSYRKGDQVYWTAKKVMLAAGETVLSDGNSDIRGRCGNRISDVPRLPVEARGPGEEELDTTDGPVEVAYAFDGAAGGGSHQLTYFDNGAGQLAVRGGVPAQARSSGFASIPGSYYPSGLNGTPTTVVGPANERASTGGSSSDPGDADTATLVPTPAAVPTPAPVGQGSVPVPVATGGDATTETPPADVAAGPATPLPIGGTGSTPPAPVGLPVGLPDGLGDTDQPVVDVDLNPPAVPGTVLWPVELPAVPLTPAETVAEAPEPATLWLGGIGLAALVLMRRRPRRVA